MRKFTTNYQAVLIFLVLFFRLGKLQVSAQVFGNEWINPNQKYFKVKITEKGIHQISFEALQKAGFPENVNPEKIQVFRHGKEVAISTHNAIENQFQAKDYLEFYAEPNDGTLDSLLYQPRYAQAHQYYNLFSDTASYFITYTTENQKNKRIITQEKKAFTNLKSTILHSEEELQVFTSSFVEGQPEPIGSSLSSGILNSSYSFGKGFTGEIQKPNIPLILEVQLKNFIKDDLQKPSIEILLTGRSEGKHQLQISINDSIKDSLIFENFFSKHYQKTFDFSTEKVKISILSTSANDQYSVAFLKINYPQRLEMKGVSEKMFYFSENGTSNRLLSIQNPPTNAFVYDISDKFHPIKIDFQNDSLLIFQSIGKAILVSNQIKKPSAIEQVYFTSLPKNKANFLIITHPKLLKSAREYATYRTSEKGGNYDTLCVTTDYLYNFFTFGDKSPLAIQRFLSFMKNTEKSQFAFLIGTATYPQNTRKNLQDYQLDLVPTWGFPCGDIPFGMDLSDKNIAFSIGRLSTNKSQTVLDYLEKVKEHEAQGMSDLWRKKALMLSGGRSIFELNTFKDYSLDLKAIAENGLLGHKVELLSKKTDNPTEFINVTEQVNQGIGMISLFGHSASQQTDMDIGYVSNDLFGYKNQGKYPFILVNGCNAGDLFATQNSFGTDWINTPKRGAILFLAHSYLSYSFSLKSYSETLLQTLFQDSLSFDKPFGTVMQKSIQRYLSKYPNSAFELANAQQFTLQGDPAVVLFPASKPDFSVDNSSIFLTHKTEFSDTLKIGIIIKNLGKISHTPLAIQLKRSYPNGKFELFRNMIQKPISYQDTLYFSIPNEVFNSEGNNIFEVTVDADNTISELQENNNTAKIEYNFTTQNIRLLYPKNFEIVNQQSIDFQIEIPQNTNNKNIVFELDTNHLFRSQYKKSIILSHQKFLEFNQKILEKDSTVYYWRVKFEDENWIENSFLYLKNSPSGFAQFNFPQLAKSNTDERIYLKNNQWNFQKNNIIISGKIYGTNSGVARSHRANLVMLNDKVLISDGVCYPWYNLNAVAFNRALHPYSVIPNLVCGYAPYAVNYLSTESFSTDLQDYFASTEYGNYVMLWNSGHLEYPNWSTEFRQNFATIGVDTTKIKNLSKGSPFLVIGKKGAKKALLELFPDAKKRGDTQILSLENFRIEDHFNEGIITSPVIGVANEWQDIVLNIDQKENQVFSFDILGINLQGEIFLIYENIQQKPFDISNIDAKKFPYLQIKIRLKTNDFSEEVAQLKSLIIHYQSPPEGIASTENVAISNKQEYENFKINATFKNISNHDFTDSIVVRQVLKNIVLNKNEVKNIKVKSLIKKDSVHISVPIETAGFVGENTFSLTFNPAIIPEQSYQNNTVFSTFKVIPDKTNPILSVTFDGRLIQQYEIVSSKPLIQISLKDENRYRIKKDTNGIDLQLKYCFNCSFKKIYFSQNDITWQSDSLTNTFLIDYFPQDFPENDTLTLRVQAQDVAGNYAGTVPYQISFRNFSKQILSNWQVSPNPFSSQTVFSFQLKDEIPEEFAIEVFDFQGRKVAILGQALKIGFNQINWDTKDLANNYLPSGTYFYRLILRNKAVDLALGTCGKLIILH